MSETAPQDVVEALNVSRETLARLETYAALLRKWNPAINLVSKSTISQLWTRHIVDSAQIFDLAPNHIKSWADFGSGGGFPGLVVAILAAEASPETRVTLVESDIRKATFLRTVARETNVQVDVISERIESIPSLQADMISARALAALPLLLEFCERHLHPKGVALFPKGETYQSELKDALASWRFEVENFPSKTDSKAVVLKLEGIERV